MTLPSAWTKRSPTGDPARHQIFVPLRRAAAAGEFFHRHAEVGQVQGGALGRRLLDPLMLGAVHEGQRRRALGDAHRLVVRAPPQHPAVARHFVAVGVVGEAGGHRAADRRHRMRARRPGGRIGVDAGVGLAGDVADGVISIAFAGAAGDHRGDQPAQRIIGEAFGQTGVEVGARQQVALLVIGEGLVFHRSRQAARRRRLDGGSNTRAWRPDERPRHQSHAADVKGLGADDH